MVPWNIISSLRSAFVQIIVRPPRQTEYHLLGGQHASRAHFSLGQGTSGVRRDFALVRAIRNGADDDDDDDMAGRTCGGFGPAPHCIYYAPRRNQQQQQDTDRSAQAALVQIQCSHYTTTRNERLRAEARRMGESAFIPVVIYAHGNSGCRADATEAVAALLPMDVDVLCFDFSGSGQSGGEYCTLGHNEQVDLATVVNFAQCARVAFTDQGVAFSPGGQSTDEARGEAELVGGVFASAQGQTYHPQFGHIALWGRSMGAVSALLHASQNATIAAIVLDSPFSTLTDVMSDIALRSVRIPRLLLRFAIGTVARGVRDVAGFDVRTIDALAAARDCNMPMFHGHAYEDGLIDTRHAYRLQVAYGGTEKRLVVFCEGHDHNSIRPAGFYAGAAEFLRTALKGGLKTSERLFAGIARHADITVSVKQTSSGGSATSRREESADVDAIDTAVNMPLAGLVNDDHHNHDDDDFDDDAINNTPSRIARTELLLVQRSTTFLTDIVHNRV
ncbi:AB hydrolase-1 domain-containing protein [Pycnococcus provasolii]